jgi:outer membrane lipoprotein-sorting protein
MCSLPALVVSTLLAVLGLLAPGVNPGAQALGAHATPWLRPQTPAPDPLALLQRTEKTVLGESAAYTLRMTVRRPNKPERVVEMKGWKKGDDKGLVRYTAPPRERGTAYLRSGASTWLWLPSAEKVVRVGAKQNFGGGDFSNGDIFRLSLSRDYVPRLAGEETVEGQACWKLELKARDRSVAYDRVLLWVRQDGTDFPVRAEYYTLSGRKLKWLTVSDVGRLGARTRPRRLVMENALEQGQRTELQFTSIQDDVRLDDALFTPSALERGQ